MVNHPKGIFSADIALLADAGSHAESAAMLMNRKRHIPVRPHLVTANIHWPGLRHRLLNHVCKCAHGFKGMVTSGDRSARRQRAEAEVEPTPKDRVTMWRRVFPRYARVFSTMAAMFFIMQRRRAGGMASRSVFMAVGVEIETLQWFR